MEQNYSVWLNSKKSKKKSGIYGSLDKYQEKELDLIEKDNILKKKLVDLEKQKKIIKKGRKIIKQKLLDLKPYL